MYSMKHFLIDICINASSIYIIMLVVDILRRVFTGSCCVHRTETYNGTSWDEWVALGEAPALAASLKLYKELQQLGFTIVLLTGRDEYQRNVTVKNLLAAGYTDWETLFLRYIYNLSNGH